MSKDAPCKNCSERHYGCHANCDMYASYDKEKQIKREQRKEACESARAFFEQANGAREKTNKSKIFRSPKR